MLNRVVIFFVLILMASACKKAEERSCFKKTGETDTLEIYTGQFDSLILQPRLNFELIDSPLNKIEVIGGKNLIGKIETNTNGNQLEITNENKCRFLRNFKDDILVKIYQPQVSYIFSNVSGRLFAESEIAYDRLFILSHTGAGQIDLNLNTNRFFLDLSSGNADFILRGNTNQLGLSIKSSGYGTTQELDIHQYFDLYSKSVGDIHVNIGNNNGVVVLDGKGDIILRGPGQNVLETNTGEGKIIYKN